MLLKERTAIVYGASGAVGGAVAQTFAREGARVVLAARRREPLEAAAASTPRPRPARRPSGGEGDGESGAFAHPALDGDGAAVAFDRFFGDGQAHPGALDRTDVGGAVEGFEQVG